MIKPSVIKKNTTYQTKTLNYNAPFKINFAPKLNR